MIKFEYITLRLDYNANADLAARNLNEMGKNGWELVAVLPDAPKAYIAFFKKSIEN
jgi:hypothetical protein